MSERPWYERAFDLRYLELYPHRDLASARGEIAALHARGLAGRVLDLGCGFARHVLAMLEMEIEAFGLDRSIELLAHASTLEGRDRLHGRLVRGDFRSLPFRDGVFDFAVMLFSSFGYLDERGNAEVLGEVARVLKRNGALVLDLMNPPQVRATLVPFSRSEHGGRIIEERRALLDGGRRVRKDVRVVEPGGAALEWHEDVRLYEVVELEAALARAELRVERVEGDFDGRSPAPDAPRQIVWARRSRREHRSCSEPVRTRGSWS